MINTIIFDIGNVLADFKVREYLSGYGYDDETNRIIAANTFENEKWCEVDRSVMTQSELADYLSEDCPQLREKIYLFLENLCDSIHENHYSVKLIDTLKERGLKVLVLSNYGLETYEKSKEKFEFLKHIDGGIISCYVKCVKPEPQIYDMLIEKYKLVPQESLFFDDREENIVAAREKGINAVLTDDGYASILNGLKEYGINIEA
ncbi:MAG: HAD family phosphatase [Lachnospiraceae bacterium]|nr:HAD family phosphatase [Lachnospiraceae bacterium]